jgi:hypothetical protein
MNWKLLSIAVLGLTLSACDNKKEEKKADEAAPAETMKVEEPKANEPAPAETPAQEQKKEETAKEEHKEEKKHS